MRLFFLITTLVFLTVTLAACQQQNDTWQGYVEGRFSYISANYSGVLKQLLVQRGAQVTQGQSLFVLEQQPESDVLNQAKAQVEQAQAQKNQSDAAFNLAKATLKRDESLLPKKFVSQQTVDEARSQYKQTKEQLAQAEANLVNARAKLSQAEWTTKQKTVFAPASAIVFDTYFLPGELVNAGQPVLALLAPPDIKIIFFVGEPQLSTIKLGQMMFVRCDSCPSIIKAKISFISPQAEYTPPVIYSDQTRKKLVYRIEAIPTLGDAIELHPGQPVTVSIK